MQTGDEITIEPGELVAGGDALARVDGFPIFVSNVYPGDVARVRLIEVKKGFAKADLIELVRSSPSRRAMPCPVAGDCGGCDWTALRLDKQLEAKRHILTESLRRIGKFDPASLPAITIHPSPLNYRLRSRLHSDGEAVGFYALRSNRVVPLPSECEVVGVETALAFASTPHPPSAPSPPRGEGTQWRAFRETLESRPFSPPGEKVPKADEGAGESEIWELDHNLITDDRDFTIRVDQYTWRLSTDAFFQVNRHLLGTMIRLVTCHAARVRNKKMAVDLYAGVGFFTLPMATLFERVLAVEGSPVSARYARMNVPRNVKIVETAVERARIPEADFVLLDPPRSGTRREVIDVVAARTKEIIAWLSCDPVTFARDAARLAASGWRLSSLDLIDLFPNTHHIETLSTFERASSPP